MKYLIPALLLLSLFWAQNAGAQDCSELSPSNSGSGILSELFGGDAQSIEGACQIAAGEDYYTARIEYKGYDEDDKEYKLIGHLLDANRRKVPGCDPVAIELKGRPNSADLNFNFNASAKNFTVPHIAVSYLKVTIVATDDPLSDLDLGGLSLTGTSVEYGVDHKFRTNGTEAPATNVTVSVSLTPVRAAAKIKQ